MKEIDNKFREYEVIRKDVNSQIITSFYLRPTQGDCPEFIPGDYLVFDIPSELGSDNVRREYSVSQGNAEWLRVTIKREDAPNGLNVPAGLGSAYFHDKVNEGDIVRAYGPSGKFALNRSSNKPVVLLGGGVGQTPLLAMLHSLSEQGTRETVFIHACKDGDVHAMANEVRGVQGRFPKLQSYTCYETPLDTDVQGKDFDSAGYITKEILKSLIPSEPTEFYLCGPGPFMETMYGYLSEFDVDDDLINYEFFGPATLLKTKATRTAPTKETQSDALQVTFSKSDVTVPWDPEIDNLLELAEEYGVMADYSCRAGSCESCKASITAGEIQYIEEPFENPGDDFVLLCVASPKSNVTIDI